MKIQTLHDLVLDLTDKNNGRYFTTEEFNRTYRISELELFDECIGATNKKLDNRTLVAYGKSQNTDVRLDPFRKTATLIIVDGEVNLPTDCEKITSIVTSKARPKALTRIDEDRLGMLFDNPLREPNADEVYYMEGKKSLLIYGEISSVYITYLKTPTKGEYKTKTTTITAGSRTVTREVFDQLTSVDIEWNEREVFDLANRVLAKFSIPMKDNFIAQSVQNNKNNE